MRRHRTRRRSGHKAASKSGQIALRFTVEQLGQLGGGMGAVVPKLDQVRLLGRLELGLLAAEPPLGLGHCHPFAGPGPGEVRLELGDHREHGEQQPADRVVRVVDGAADVESDAAGGEFVDDVAGVGDGSGEPVELGDDQGVAGSAGGQCLAKAGPGSVGAGEPWST